MIAPARTPRSAARLIGAGPTLILALAFAAPAPGATSCSVNVPGGVAFGSIEVLWGLPTDTTGAPIQVTCAGADGQVPYTVALDAGAGSGASVASRRMQRAGDPGSLLAYSLYRSAADRAAGAPWGGSGATILSTSLTIRGGSGTNASPAYGRVFGGQQTAKVGLYTDVITITVSY